MLTALLAVLSLSIPHLCLAQGLVDKVANVTRAFTKAKIVPKVIRSFTPIDTLNLNFTDSATQDNVPVITGALLTIEQTASEPHFSLGNGKGPRNFPDPLIGIKSNFVIVMIDPDAPTPQTPNVSQALHFVGGNFTADSSGALSNSSAALVEYLSPAPPEGSDPHRYIALIYDQPLDFDVIGPMFANSSTSRFNFSVSDFARSTKLRNPIAGNFFLVARTDSSSSNSSSASSTPSPSQTMNGTAIASATDAGVTSAAAPDQTSGLPSLTPITPTGTGASASPVSTSAAVSGKVNVPIAALMSTVSAVVLVIASLM